MNLRIDSSRKAEVYTGVLQMKIGTTAIAAYAFLATSVHADSLVKVSWYGPGFQGNRTACGVTFNSGNSLIVAHRTLPCGTVVRFHNPHNGATHVGIVADRGPYRYSRTFDLSRAGADALGYRFAGEVPMAYTIIGHRSDYKELINRRLRIAAE